MTIDKTIKSLVIPPPVQGWNTRDPISAMDSSYALELENMFPGYGSVSIRNGSTIYAGGVGSSTVRSLGGSPTLGMLAVGESDKKVYSVSSGSSTDISGGVAFSDSVVGFLPFKDRIFIKQQGSTSNDVYHWTGTGNITASAFTGPSGDDKDLMAMGAYRNRIYFGQTTGSVIWYAGYDSITGVLTSYDISTLLRLGAGTVSILFVGSSTRSKQYAEDDLFVVVTRFGEVLIFTGESPGNPNWALLGRYYIPRPVGLRAFIYIGSSLCIITEKGLLRVNDLLSGEPTNGWPMMSDIIGDQFKAAYGNGFPYYQAGANYANGNYIIMGYAPDGSTPNAQFVMNTNTGAWTKFTGMEAHSWFEYNGALYFGSTNGKVMLADSGYYDENPANPTGILTRTIKMRPAYNFFGDPSRKKRMLWAIPHMYQSEGLQLTMDADMDFQNVAATQTVTPDNTDTSYKYYAPKVGLNGYGKCASIRIDQSVTTKRMSIQAIEVFFEPGGVL